MHQLALAVLLVSPAARGQGAKNEIFDELVNVGMQIPGGPRVKLPAPLLRPDRPPKIDAALLEKAADKVPVELFLKRSDNAPIALTIDSLENARDERCAQLITLRFVVYAKLDDVVQGDVLKRLLGGKGKAGTSPDARAAVLSASDLKKRGIALSSDPKVVESYGTITMVLLDKVQVEGVTRSLRTIGPGAALYANKLDDRFQNDKEYPNRWRPIVAAGDDDKLGPPQPYTGLGGYALVSALLKDVAPADALLVEMCLLLHEPPVWFGSRNLLRAKMRLPLEENVRSFRRTLKAK